MSTAGDIADLLFGDVGDFGARWRVWSARRAKTTAAKDLVVGQRAKVAGVARPLEDAMIAPFTQRPALAYRVTLLEKSFIDVQGRAETIWKTTIREIVALPFLLDDDSTTVLVDPRMALLGVPDQEVKEHPHVNDDNPSFRAYLRRRGVISTMYMGIAGEHRFFESILAPGERVAVWGHVGETAGVASAGYRDAAMRAKTIVSTPLDRGVILRA